MYGLMLAFTVTVDKVIAKIIRLTFFGPPYRVIGLHFCRW